MFWVFLCMLVNEMLKSREISLDGKKKNINKNESFESFLRTKKLKRMQNKFYGETE